MNTGYKRSGTMKTEHNEDQAKRGVFSSRVNCYTLYP